MRRRELLAGAAGILVGKSVEAREKKPNVETVRNGDSLTVRGESRGADELHTAVEHKFIAELEKEIKNPNSKVTIGHFALKFSENNGVFSLEYSATLAPAKKETEIHRIVDMRGFVWTGTSGSKAGVEKLYAEKIRPWQERMRKTYPNTTFWSEEASDGNDQAYHRAVLMKGASK